MVKVACFQATALDAHVVVVVGPECLCSILKDSFGWMEPKEMWIEQLALGFISGEIRYNMYWKKVDLEKETHGRRREAKGKR